MKRKHVSLISLLLMLTMLLSSCGGNPTTSAGGSGNTDGSGEGSGATEAQYVIKAGYNGSFGPEYPAYQGLELFKSIVEEKTNGLVSVELYLQGELGDGRTCAEGVQLGTIEMTDIENAVMVNFNPCAALYDLPFLFQSLEHAHAVIDGEIGQTIAKQYEELGFKHLGYEDGGFRYWTNDVRPIYAPSDLNGLKMRVMESEVMIATMNAFGATGVPMAFSELYTALQQGTVDGEDNPLDTIQDAHFSEVQDYLTLSQHFYYPRQYVMNLNFYNSLPEDVQKIIDDAAIEAVLFEREVCEEYNADIVDNLAEEGMQVNELTEEGKAEFIRLAQEKVWPQFYEQIGGGDEAAGKAIVDQVVAMGEEYS